MRFTALKTTLALYTPLFDYWAVGASLQNSLIRNDSRYFCGTYEVRIPGDFHPYACSSHPFAHSGSNHLKGKTTSTRVCGNGVPSTQNLVDRRDVLNMARTASKI
jgi:hypothetical protein